VIAVLLGGSAAPSQNGLERVSLTIGKGFPTMRTRAKTSVLIWVVLLLVELFSAPPARADEQSQPAFQRGDANGDGVVDMVDAIWTFQALFLGAGEMRCTDALDSNDDGTIDISDPLFTLYFLYTGGPDIWAPGPCGCGGDPTADSLSCQFQPRCRTVVIHEFEVPSFSPLAPEAAAREENSWPSAVKVRDAKELEAALAAPSGDRVIYVEDDAEVDLTGSGTLRIPGGVTLAGGRRGLNQGGLVYTNSRQQSILFEVRGDYARITGLRFRGPSSSADSDQESAVAIQVPNAYWVTIDNNEFYNWTGAAVEVQETTPVDCVVEVNRLHQVRVGKNYFHHNQRQGLGYGVVASYGGFPYIVANTFDHNRHAIAADGRPRTGYRAHLNLILSGGEEYCNPDGVCWYEQHFDMHGRGPDYLGGVAGEYVDIAYNTFRGAQEYGNGLNVRAAFYLRGTPCQSAHFHHNMLLHKSEQAVRNHSEENNVFLHDNQYDVDTSDELGVGDFDGDRVSDVFMATGAAWYYSSGGQTEWRYLNASSTRLSELTLADFDGNGTTDVLMQSGSDLLLSYDGRSQARKVNTSGTVIGECKVGDFDGDRKADLFRSDGEHWYVSWGASSGWETIGTSSYSVEDLRFGDFNGDGVTDVFGLANGQWSVSWGGRSQWQRLNEALASDLDRLVLSDFDGDGVTDIAQTSDGRWRVSWGGASLWQALRDVSTFDFDRLEEHLIGDFDGKPGADALRYEVVEVPEALPRFLKGNRFVLSSGAVGAHTTHSRYDMK
jgi:hypothetical protein